VDFCRFPMAVMRRPMAVRCPAAFRPTPRRCNVVRTILTEMRTWNESLYSVGLPQMNYGTFAPKNFRSRERKYHGMELLLPRMRNFRSLELSLPRQVTFGHRRRLHGGDHPHSQKVVGAMPSSCPHRNFDAIFETVKCSVKL